ncbi:Biotin carboxyl carrier protein of acetyl-CoA carboxylase [Planococcus massiliensis]|uniref:Biotin carboxyl carrier protein of acetyl-CoA carboxylase n=1 Tax=Planococcus massiliensis TaxID=1499687 RepID=A0A098EKQ3_9BACL|nr:MULTISPECIES: acetyl-CoA carboxylase biotin carboxyl carrier protein [Planococcus]MCJ1908833.1 acetyl-CoA carboxylase biotin carboxyl carrier protein [Planococcus ruber]CEG22939.1 Biotin carboxyl carrier protein of acetyl-CoA carboxylase [Planococcus massiliensis]
MKIQEIREIIKLVDNSSIDEFTYESEGTKVKLKKSGSTVSASAPVQASAPAAEPAAQPAKAPVSTPAAKAEELISEEAPEVPAAQEENMHKILSPMVGTFYQSPSPEEEAYVQPGTKVSADQVVCIVEAMKLFNEIEAEVDGEIAEILVKDGQLVEYGQPLFLVKTK